MDPTALKAWRKAERERLIAYTVEKAGWTEEMVRDYYMNVMVYDMDEGMVDGLREFQRRLLANGFSDAHHFPELVRPEDADLDTLARLGV